jgi:transmembrane sensor
MVELYNDIDEVIARQLSGEQSAEDEALIARWLAADEANAQYYRQLKRLWSVAPSVLPPLDQSIDTEAALRKVKNSFATAAPQPVVKRLSLWYTLAAAASVCLLVAVFVLLRRDPVLPETIIAANDKVVNNTLSDGSMVALNRHAVLTTRLTDKQRRVKLQGEAFFEVKPDVQRPFVVEVTELEIKVVGTAFNVDQQTDSNMVKVSVKEGKVRLQHADQAILLVAGQQAIFNRREGRIETLSATVHPNTGAFRDRILTFDNTSFTEVLNTLKAVYGVEFVVKNQRILNCHASVRFSNMSLERILEILKDTHLLTITPSGDNYYILDGPGC